MRCLPLPIPSPGTWKFSFLAQWPYSWVGGMWAQLILSIMLDAKAQHGIPRARAAEVEASLFDLLMRPRNDLWRRPTPDEVIDMGRDHHAAKLVIQAEHCWVFHALFKTYTQERFLEHASEQATRLTRAIDRLQQLPSQEY